MIFGNEKERALEKVLQGLALWAQEVAYNHTLSIERRMELVQWLSRGYNSSNKALIKLKTEQVHKK